MYTTITNERAAELARLARFAAGHGHLTVVDRPLDCVRVGVEWINGEAGTRGVEWLTARDLPEMRDVLGY